MSATPQMYGDAMQAAHLLRSVAQLVAREPDHTFTDQGVRTEARSLIRLIERRLEDGDEGG